MKLTEIKHEDQGENLFKNRKKVKKITVTKYERVI